ncbi:MAG: threonine synthase [archaeon]
MFATGMRCTKCGTEYPMNEAISVCSKCQGLLDVQYNYDQMQMNFKKENLQNSSRGLWRYAQALPIEERFIVSLGEGFTPLLPVHRLENKNIMLKLDHINPSGSFKDRGATIIVSKANELRRREIAIDSTGNAAASVSAYAAKSAMKCYVFIPAHTEAEKVTQISSSGATVISVKGTRQDVHDLIEAAYREFGWYYCGFMVSPYAIEGTKTIAYEICEQLHWDPPDWIVFPVGTGSGIVGCYKGLEELVRIGWISKMPRLACIQPETCAPISGAHLRGRSTIIPVERPETVAEGLAVGNPPKGTLVLEAIRKSEGVGETVNDDEILRAAKDLAAKEGQFVEVSAAASVAGAFKLLDKGIIDENERVVCELTGTGLKSSREYAKLTSAPYTTDPNLESLIKALGK